MRGMDETYGMGAGASVKKGKTAKQVRRARKAIDAQKSKPKPKVSMSSKPDAVNRAGYRAPGTKAKAKVMPSASSSPKTNYGARKSGAAFGGLGSAIKGVGRGLSGIQNKKKK